MNRFTWAELADMHLLYGEVRCNAVAAQQLYAQRFPQRVLPDHRRFVDVHRQIRETGSVAVSVLAECDCGFMCGTPLLSLHLIHDKTSEKKIFFFVPAQ